MNAAITEGWVHLVRRDPAGGLQWRPCPRGESPLRAEGRYLVTGASGALGRHLCAWLAEEHDARLVGIGRGAVGPEGLEWVRADLADPEAARAAGRTVGAVDGVFHLAGTVGPEAMAVKRDGLLALEEGVDAGFWVLFSSIAGVLPGLDRGLEAYAEANRWLDTHARERHAAGHRVVSIAWPPWEGAGMARGLQASLHDRGIEPVEPQVALAALEHALGSGEPQVVVLHRPASRASPLPEDLPQRLRQAIADAAGLPPERVGDDVPLTRLGIDSVAALDLVQEIEAIAGRDLPTTLLYETGTYASVLRALQAGATRTTSPRSGAVVGGPSEAAPTETNHRPEARSLLPAQETFAVQQRYFPDVPGNTLLACRVAAPGGAPLDPDRLAGALRRVADRHPALRSAIRRDGDRWVQVPGATEPLLEVVARADWREVHAQPFDLARGPMLRVVTDGRRLVLDAPHAVVDAWSLKNVLEDLLRSVADLRAGGGGVLPPLRSTWPEAAEALRAAADPDTTWWEARYRDGIPPLPLPWTGPVDAPTAGPFHALRTVLDREATARLQARAQATGVTLPSFVLATWLRVLWEHSGQHDLVVRVAQGRREVRLPDVDRLVGSFADSLPVRVTLDPAESLEALAEKVQAEVAAVQAHAASSAAGLAKLAPRSPAGPVGLTPAGFSFPRLPAARTIGDLDLSDVHGASANGFTRLGLIAWTFDGRLHASWNHPASHLAPATVDRMALRHQQLMRGQEFPVSTFHRMRGQEFPVSTFHGQGARPRTLHGRILARCRRHPDRPAVGRLTYRRLAHRSAAVGGHLRGPRVAVLARPGPPAVIALLAILRAGAAWVPLDPDWPAERIRQVLEVAGVEQVVAPTELAEQAAATGLEVVHTDAEPVGAPLDLDEPDALAHVMFTSGSTGRPKGVMVSHRAVLAFQDWVIPVFGVTSTDRFAQTSSLAFGGAIRQVFTPLLTGASIHPVPPGLARDPDALVAFLRDERITIWNSVPSLWVHLMDALERTGDPDPLPSVRWVLLGGEAVPAAHVGRWLDRYRHRYRLANLYGSTETVVNATWHEVVRRPEGVHTPIGWPRAGVEVHLLDVQDGVGEIAVGGAIAEGYLHAPERTAESFVAHPRHGRIYRTGDLARQQPDGALVYVGRVDTQVQVYGNRVELAEIEHTLVAHPDVEHAVVVQREDGRLHAAVAGTAEAQELRAWVRQRLPRFMVPHQVAVGPTLPRTPAGKADRRRIAAAAASQPPGGAGKWKLETPDPCLAGKWKQETPDPLLGRLAGLWQEVLELEEPPGPDDDFFALGGDSLLALAVLDRLRPQVEAVPSPLALYRAPTLAAMARAVAEAAPGPGPREAPDEGAFPLTAVQRGFWLAHQAAPEHPPLWTAQVPVHGPLDPAAFRRALTWVVARHEALRIALDDGAAQTVRPAPAEVPLQYDDLSVLPPAAQEHALETRWGEEAAVRMAPDAWPLFRIRLIRLGGAEHHLLLSAHHAIADAWSAWLLTGDLLAAHDAFARGTAPERSPAPRLRDHLPPEPPEDPWWRGALAGLEQQPAPDRPHDTRRRVRLDEAGWAGLRRAARDRATTPWVFVLAALFQALAEVTGRDDLVVSTAHASREGATEVVGSFARGLPVRVRGEPTVQTVAGAFADAAAHAEADPAAVVAAAGERGLARLGRYFLTWLDPAAVPLPASDLRVDWSAGRYRFATRGSGTEVMVGALVHEGLLLDLYGAAPVGDVAPVLERRLRGLCAPQAALVVYVPRGLPAPLEEPQAVERVDAALATSELVLLPRRGDDLAEGADLERAVDAAVRASSARVIALAGLLPSLTGLGARPLGRPDQVVTTGHAATVVAMVRTLQRVLAETGRRWADETVGYLGYGAIGTAVRALAEDVLGAPADTRIRDPRLDHADPLDDATLILGATSGGRALEVDRLAPGTLVIDDSFPRAFDDAAATARMTGRRDVLLLGGGMLDAGPLERSSPFPQAEALRAQYGARWLPGCHAEALLVAAFPELGPTVGPVGVERARAMWEAVAAAGWAAPPLHLGPWTVPEEVIAAVARGYGGGEVP